MLFISVYNSMSFSFLCKHPHNLIMNMFVPLKKTLYPGFPGGAVVKNPPANAGDMGLSPGPARSHMPRSS